MTKILLCLHSEVLLQTSAQDSPTAKVESSLVINNSSGKLHPLSRALFQFSGPGSICQTLCARGICILKAPSTTGAWCFFFISGVTKKHASNISYCIIPSIPSHEGERNEFFIHLSSFFLSVVSECEQTNIISPFFFLMQRHSSSFFQQCT